MTDRFTVRAVALGLVVVVVLCVAAAAVLAAIGKGIPEMIVTTGASALGATAALLARTTVEPIAPAPVPNNETPAVP